ncbi:MAG: HD domain-containing protein, partial [Oceanidesulfovibrio sp.]
PKPFHDESVLEHTAQSMDRAAALHDDFPRAERSTAVWMSLCHDLGKCSTDPDIWPRHYNHEGRGESAAERLAERLRLSNRLRRAGAMASRHHMNIGRYTELRPGTRVDLLEILHKANLVEEMLLATAADGDMDADAAIFTALRADLSRMLAVELPHKDRGKGPASGGKLRMLRCQALAEGGPDAWPGETS